VNQVEPPALLPSAGPSAASSCRVYGAAPRPGPS